MEKLFGRKYEISLIEEAKKSGKAELGIVYGRRRIGKSFLLETLLEKGDLYFEAIRGLNERDQIQHFLKQFREQTKSSNKNATTWAEAFDIITPYLIKGSRYVIFDEVPWMASEKTKLIGVLKFYWDRHWKKNSKLSLVLCGSIANFMLKHIVHSQSLHNRKTFELKMDPLPCNEAALFLNGKRSKLEVSKFLMIFGGVPKYLEQIDANKSLYHNLDRLCFTKAGFFVNEFSTIFKEQFKVTRNYEEIVRALADGPMTKEEISIHLRMKTGGGLTNYLKHLETADFIRGMPSVQLKGGLKSKTVKYILWDEWLQFFFTYIEPHMSQIVDQSHSGLAEGLLDRSIDTYFGLNFEKFCLKNINKILEKLEISPTEVISLGPYFQQSSRSPRKKVSGAQVDILIARKGHVLTLIECKYKSDLIGSAIVKEIDDKISRLRISSKFSIEKVLIAANGVQPKLESSGYFNQILTLTDFFNS